MRNKFSLLIILIELLCKNLFSFRFYFVVSLNFSGRVLFMHETEDSHFNETHFYAKCFSLWHYNPLKNTTYHRIMNAVAIIYFHETRLNLRLLLQSKYDVDGACSLIFKL